MPTDTVLTKMRLTEEEISNIKLGNRGSDYDGTDLRDAEPAYRQLKHLPKGVFYHLRRHPDGWSYEPTGTAEEPKFFESEEEALEGLKAYLRRNPEYYVDAKPL